MKITHVLNCAALGAAVLLAGCGNSSDLSRTFGLTRDAPDEFMVTTRAPLSMPPDYSLRPPQPGAPRPQEQSTTASAEAAVAGGSALNAPVAAATTPGQDALLSAAGQPAPSNIRSQIEEETAKNASSHALTETLLFWQKPPPPGTAVDPQKEAARLQENAALGKAPDDGNTPVIKKKTTSIFDNWF